MTDKKFTDEEIKSSLEVIATTGNCDECKIGYYPLSTNSKSCLNDGLRDIYFSNYFLNFETFKYEKCSNRRHIFTLLTSILREK